MDDFSKLGNFCEEDFDDSWEDQMNSESSDNLSTRYTEKEHIASGGMKDIFKVYDKKLNRYIAMAQLIPGKPEELCELFMKEATLTASLEHPNIISVYDLGITSDHDPFFTMELKVGDSLDQIIINNKLPQNELLEIFLKVCDAISYAHSHDILHLDLKPENIQVGKFGEVQVCDWGVSRSTKDTKSIKKLSGTPGYMAPEQCSSDQELDNAADIYSLGAILYSLLTQARPIAGGVETVIEATMYSNILSPCERFPEMNISESLDAVVRKAMSEDKADRYKSVEALKLEVGKFLTGYSTKAEDAGFIKELKLFISRNKQVCLVGSIAFSLICLGSFIFINKIQESQKQTELALVDLKTAHTDLQELQTKERKAFKQKEAALQRYIQEKQERQKMHLQLLDNELKQAYDLMTYPLYFSSPKASIDKSYIILKDLYDPNKRASGLKNLLLLNLFISQKYSEVVKLESNVYQELINIAEKYKDKKRTKFGILNEPTFVQLLGDINALSNDYSHLKNQVVERSICYMVDVRKPVFTSLDVVVELIKCWNPEWDTSQINYDRKTLTLSLKGKRLHKLMAQAGHSSNLCFLRFLKIDNLDIRHTTISGLHQIIGLNINNLDIRNTPINSLHPHEATKGISEVYLTKGQFNAVDTRHIPYSVKLIYK